MRIVTLSGERTRRAAGTARSGRDRRAPGRMASGRGWPPVAGAGFSWLIPQRSIGSVIGLGSLGVVVWVNLRTLHPAASGAGAEVLVAVIVAAAAWLAWMATDPGGVTALGALAVMGAAGGVVSSAGPAGMTFVGIAAAGAAVARGLIAASVLAAAGPLAFILATLAGGSFPGRLAPVAAVCLLGLVSGTGRRQLFERARQAALIALADERAEIAGREAALAAERNRLGRELHDVLAHTLGALSVQLSALDALVETGVGAEKLRGEIERSHKLVDEGVDEAHQAVRALREHPRPLVEELARLCGQRGATLEVSGTPRPVQAEAYLALYRVAQEALTNAAKHAPGAPVAVQATFSPGTAALTVRNRMTGRPARCADGGYGLAGMRERVLLTGGQCHAGPAEGGWQVTARVPI